MLFYRFPTDSIHYTYRYRFIIMIPVDLAWASHRFICSNDRTVKYQLQAMHKNCSIHLKLEANVRWSTCATHSIS